MIEKTFEQLTYECQNVPLKRKVWRCLSEVFGTMNYLSNLDDFYIARKSLKLHYLDAIARIENLKLLYNSPGDTKYITHTLYYLKFKYNQTRGRLAFFFVKNEYDRLIRKEPEINSVVVHKKTKKNYTLLEYHKKSNTIKVQRNKDIFVYCVSEFRNPGVNF